MSKPLVSVVVPTFNSERFLRRCLQSIRCQKYPRIDIIVIDNWSTDRTRQIAESLGARVVSLKGIRSKARNVGVGLATGKFVFSIDSDMELTQNVVSECVVKAESGFDAVIIPEISFGEGFWAKCRALEKTCYIGDDLIEAARFFRKGVFERAGGYDSRLVFGEDWDLNQRIRKAGFRIGRISAVIKHNEGRLSLRESALKKHYYGKTLDLYRRKHPEEAKQQLKLLRPAFYRNWRKLKKEPINALGMLFMKTCEFLLVKLELSTVKAEK